MGDAKVSVRIGSCDLAERADTTVKDADDEER